MESQFRVIVIGAGVAGLAASHCLQRAGIDHVVLERRSEIAPPEGASITVFPHVLRVFNQLGCMKALFDAGTLHDRAWTRWADGSVAANSGLYDYIKENHGIDVLPLERRAFLQVVYDNLPDKSKIRTSAAVKNITETTIGVEVTLADGTIEKGDIVLGCDGVHSLSRSIMWDHAAASNPAHIPKSDKTAFKTYWKCLLGVGPRAPSLGRSDSAIVHNDGYSFLILAQPHCSFFFVFFHLDKPFAASERLRYTDQDAEDLAASVADQPITESLTFGDLWNGRARGTLISLEEGILQRWHHGRTVLAGDAVHKMTPNIALGGNTAIEDIVLLTNKLHRLLSHNPKPTASDLTAIFTAYNTERLPRTKFATDTSGLMSRIQAQTTPLHKALAWILPYLPDRGAADMMLGEYIRKGPVLDFVEEEKENGEVVGVGKGKVASGEGEKKGSLGKVVVTVVAAFGVAAVVQGVRGVLAAF
ncbi:hypothetical protein B0T14DRAFT_538471 [Immersiella caudata]|uniref:FAD-binding domain-containing protein n=1 Tax=Immersiella caudata TaxID=314043 RepID=A0AA39WJL5_9PEZI|nr:hypothetical protein B0T14DRAFT_538471 [Immersiella caudata]